MIKIRLHKFITNLVKTQSLEFTGPEIQKNIQSLGVLVNSKLEFNRLLWVTEADKISISDWPKREVSDFSKVKTIWVNQDLMIIFKPADIVVETGNGHLKNNLVEYFKSQNLTVFPVHRIDKSTSGLLILAKNKNALDFYQQLFKKRKIVKKYLAILNGELTQTIKITNLQARHSVQKTRQQLYLTQEQIPKKEKFRQSISIFKPIAFCFENQQTLAEIQIFTGRMHQIRLQAESLQMPILGDEKYSKIPKFPLKNTPNLKTINLSPKILNLEKNQFVNLNSRIFDNSQLKLLANYLNFQLQNGEILELELFNLANFSL